MILIRTPEQAPAKLIDTYHHVLQREAGSRSGRQDQANDFTRYTKGQDFRQKRRAWEWEIDPAELHRIYEPVPAGTDTHTDANGTADSREIELLREMLADKDKQIEGLNRRLEAVDEERRTTLRQLTALLTDQRAKPAPDVIVTPPPTSNAPLAAPPAPAAEAPAVKPPPVTTIAPAEQNKSGNGAAKGKSLFGWLTG